MLASLLLFAAEGGSQGLAEFEANLAAHDSATLALQQWCAARQIADPAEIRAVPVVGQDAPEPKGLRHLLGVPPAERIGYRHVRLICGDTILSEAHNWYVPSRLTPAMNHVLENTDTPFGKVAASLQFRRKPLSLSHDLGSGCPAEVVSTHQAMLHLPDGTPLALVMECYTAANLR
ncbi:MAG: hypothetical protein RLZZ136_16 [Pseudomonadota bacterium]